MNDYRRQAAEERRRRILAVAGEMFLEQGFEAVSISEIIRELGGSKATLYSYFPSKADLFVAVVADQVESLVGTTENFLQERGDLRETLERLGRTMLSVSLSPRMIRLHRVGVSELYRHPEIVGELEKLRRHLAEPVIAFFRRVSEEGQLAIADPELATDQFRELCGARLFNPVLFGLRDAPQGEDLAAAVKEAVDLFMRGYEAGRAANR